MDTKTLHFYAHGLPKDTTVILVFEPPNNNRLFKDQYPVVWKVITFRARGDARAHVRYSARLALGYAQIDQDQIVDGTAWVEIGGAGPDGNGFGKNSEENGPKHLEYKNDTNNRANLSIGLITGSESNQHHEPIFLWTGVGAGSKVTTQFIPKLTAYVTRDYKASQVLRGEVETDSIWTQNLNELDDISAWRLLEDDESGTFSIVPWSSD